MSFHRENDLGFLTLRNSFYSPTPTTLPLVTGVDAVPSTSKSPRAARAATPLPASATVSNSTQNRRDEGGALCVGAGSRCEDGEGERQDHGEKKKFSFSRGKKQ